MEREKEIEAQHEAARRQKRLVVGLNHHLVDVVFVLMMMSLSISIASPVLFVQNKIAHH